MKITRVDIVPFEPVFPGGGYAMSHVIQTQLHTRLVRLVTDTGVEGYGEIVRKSAAVAAECEPLEDERLPELDGCALADLPGLLGRWRADGLPYTTLAAGIELALYDLWARQAGMPLSAFLGGPATGEVGAYLSLSSGDLEEMAAKVRARPGHPVVQSKLGVYDVESDMRRVEAVLAAMAPDQTLLADFNGALDVETAKRALPAIRDPRLTWEDPCLAYEDNAEVSRHLDQPVMFDMCLGSVDVFLRAIREGVAGSLVIKPPFMGGLGAARTARDLCIAARIPFRVDGPWCGPLGSVANVHLALGAPPDLLLSSADLMDPFEDPNPMIHHPRPGYISPAAGPGLGHIPNGLFDSAS